MPLIARRATSGFVLQGYPVRVQGLGKFLLGSALRFLLSHREGHLRLPLRTFYTEAAGAIGAIGFVNPTCLGL